MKMIFMQCSIGHDVGGPHSVMFEFPLEWRYAHIQWYMATLLHCKILVIINEILFLIMYMDRNWVLAHHAITEVSFRHNKSTRIQNCGVSLALKIKNGWNSKHHTLYDWHSSRLYFCFRIHTRQVKVGKSKGKTILKSSESYRLQLKSVVIKRATQYS